MKRYFTENNNYCRARKGFLQFAICFSGLAGIWLLLKSGMGLEYNNAIGTTIKLFGDCALALCWFWLLPSAWRWLGLVPVWSFAIWGLANMAYFRFWNDLIPAASVTMGGNIDGNLMEYGISLLQPSDWSFIIIPLLASISYAACNLPYNRKLWENKRERTRIPKSGFKAFIICLAIGVIGQAAYFKTSWNWRNAISERDFKTALSDHFAGGFSEYHKLYAYNGPAYYFVRYLFDIAEVMNSQKTLSIEERNEISQYLTRYERHGGNRFTSDSLNVVYIIVESLNSDMIEKEISRRKIMPCLDSLSRLEGTVWIENAVSQIRASSSSDGHLLLLTGLMPPEKISYSITFGSTNKFPSLADYMPHHEKRLLLADDGVCWNEGNTLSNFGLGSPQTSLQRPQSEIDRFGRDGAMFHQASQMVKDLKKPFFMTLMTISMHIPFKEKAWTLPDWIDKDGSLTGMEKDYANACNHTDKYIGEFIDRLPDNTLVFIASDHHQSIAAGDDGKTYSTMMAIHTPRTLRLSNPTGQANLFPATLDILGIGEGYGGVAPSALDTLSKSDYKKATGISDMIIRGNYFNQVR